MRRYELMMFPRALGKVALVGGHLETLAEALEEVRLWCARGVPDRSCEELNFWRAWPASQWGWRSRVLEYVPEQRNDERREFQPCGREDESEIHSCALRISWRR